MKNELTKIEIDSYIQNTIIPMFLPLVDINIKSAIWNEKGENIVATNKLAKSLGFTDYKQMQGLSLKKIILSQTFNFLREKIPLLKVISKTNITSDKERITLDVLKQTTMVKDQVFATSKPINAILIHPFLNIHKTTLLLQYTPIFHPCGKVVAVQSYNRNLNIFGLDDYFAGYNQKLINIPRVLKDASDLPIKLTPRQHEILFLLTIGMTQRRIAELLNISHGTVARVVANTICPKFNINDSNSLDLIKKAKKMKLHLYLPTSLCKPWFIILDDDDIINNEL